MNLSCFIPATVGGLLALVSFQPLKRDVSISTSNRFVPAVVRLAQPRTAPSSPGTTDNWTSVEGLLERNPEEFRKLTSQEIETNALALEAMIRRADRGTVGNRSYLNTRLQALREHLDYAREELVHLPSSQGDETFIPAHAHFYRTMKSLEQAFDQAATDINGDI